jgi:hypothetical protein
MLDMLLCLCFSVSFIAGDVATWSGMVTGSLMLPSPLLFERWGWRDVADCTPNIGCVFFKLQVMWRPGLASQVAA